MFTVARRTPVVKSLRDRLMSSRYEAAKIGQPAFRLAFSVAARRALADSSYAKIEAALASGNLEAAVAVLSAPDAWESMEGAMLGAYRSVFDTAAAGALSSIRRVEKAAKKTPEGIGHEAIKRRAAELVADITKGQRDTLKAAIADGYAKGLSPAKISARVRKLVGLLPREAEAVDNRRQLHLNAGMTEARADKLADRYAAELLVRRADRIAVTETSFAEARGKRAAWSYAQDKGIVGSSAKRRWVTSDAPCPECKRLSGKTAPIEGTYRGGIEGPPLHPHCFCLEDIVE